LRFFLNFFKRFANLFLSFSRLVRDASSAASAALDKHSVELVSRRDVYLRLAALRDARPALDSVQQRLLNKMCEDYERKGVALEPAQAARLKEVNQRLAQLSVDFQSALNEENEQLLFTDDELAGLPADLISTLATAADGRRVVTLKYTHLFPVLKMARKPETRRRVEEANSKKVPENVARMHEALTLKLEAARLLGFESDAAYELSVLMAKTPANVNALLSDLNDRLTPLLEKERQQLLELKSKTEGELADGKLYAHDWRYLQQRVLQAEHNVDEERIKQYFPLEHVATQMFEIFERLFHVKVAKVTPESPNYRVWHPDVEQFVVTDAESGAELGTMFQDLFPREGKYGHACVMPLIPTYVDEANSNARNPVVVVMLANFSKPTKERPSLLDHDEVVTFFHEQGHAYHGLVSRARFARFSGTSVERDFVEA
jgi:Zn-dependent oligopeptidase